jgi:ribosomal protein S18 acetylase RimI-like enzyme
MKAQSTAYTLRAAENSDFAFARKLYLATMKTLLSQLGAWDREEFEKRIRVSFRPDEFQIIVHGNEDIGFLHLIETDTDIMIAQIHLIRPYRRRGIGTKILMEIIGRADADHKTMSLSAPRNNPAIHLYERLGFKISRDTGEAIIDMLRDNGAAKVKSGI